MSNYKLPESWQLATIKELGQIVSGGTPSTKKLEYWGGDIAWITPADLSGYSGKYIAEGKKNITNEGLNNSSARLMPAGSIHFSSRAPIGYVAISSKPLSTNQGFKSLVPSPELSKDFLYYYLKSAKQRVENIATGTTFKEISGRAFGEIPVPIPAANEQQLIADKIEELFSEIDNGIKSLKKAREQLKTYRQAVLKHAFEGKLTQEWRARQAAAGSPPEPAEKLLERIREEREAHYKQQVEDWKKACEQAKAEGRKKPVRPKKPKNLPPVTKEELSELPELPEGWQWVRLGNVIKEIFDGPYGTNLKTKDYVEDGVRVIRLENIGVLDFIEAKKFYISEEKYNLLKKHKVSYGDIIFSSFISDQTRVAILPNYIKRAINKADCFCIRVSDFYLFKKYMAFYLSTQSCYSQLAHQVHGATRPRVNTTQLKNCCIPLCSHQEQSEISYEIESRLSVCDQLEQSIEESLGKADTLRQSILKKAFSGDLTQQWREENTALISGENSAERLLERIQAEKKKAGTKEKSRAGKKKAT